jgi:hypothetical protein
MIQYFVEGGYSMILILVTALAAPTLALLRKGPARAEILSQAAVLVLLQGLFGVASNMEAVADYLRAHPEEPAAVAQGIGEAMNAGSFAAIVALLLWVGGVAARFTARSAPIAVLGAVSR